MRKILVIDDDREMADLLRQSLAQEGFELSRAQSGEEGIERGRNTGLDLILLDVNLPRHERIRSAPAPASRFRGARAKSEEGRAAQDLVDIIRSYVK